MAAFAAPLIEFALRDPERGMFPLSFCAVLAVLIFVRHQANITRLMRGTEPKIGAKKDATPATEGAAE